MDPHRVRIRTGWVVLPLVVWLVAACSMRWQTPLNPTLSEPLDVYKVPLTIGLYYGPELRAYELVRVRGKAQIVVPIGPATVPLLDRVMPRLFEAVVPVDGLPPQVQADARLAAILEPRLEEADAQFSMFMGTDYRAELTYRFTLYSLDGTPFASWTVTRYGEHGSWGDRPTAIGRATDLAMPDAMRAFASGFGKVPEVRRWLRSTGVAVAD